MNMKIELVPATIDKGAAVMAHKGAVTLETARLVLRRFMPEDAAPMFRNFYSIPEVMRFLPWETHSSVSETSELLRGYVGGYGRPDYYAWAITLKADKTPIGFLDTGIDENLNEVKLGYGIGDGWWHRGYMSEALRAAIEFFFERVGANRLSATHDPRNPRSGAVMRKCAMQYEGTLRQARRRKGEYSDRALYSILAEDYFAAKDRPAE
jgi:ribosomal-protein-alanine N-acetyltransferase